MNRRIFTTETEALTAEEAAYVEGRLTGPGGGTVEDMAMSLAQRASSSYADATVGAMGEAGAKAQERTNREQAKQAQRLIVDYIVRTYGPEHRDFAGYLRGFGESGQIVVEADGKVRRTR